MYYDDKYYIIKMSLFKSFYTVYHFSTYSFKTHLYTEYLLWTTSSVLGNGDTESETQSVAILQNGSHSGKFTVSGEKN